MIFFKAAIVVLLAIGLFNCANTAMDLYLKGGVYVCSDKEDNPPHIQQQCKRLTKGQWWSK